jgi:hypothetical protein
MYAYVTSVFGYEYVIIYSPFAQGYKATLPSCNEILQPLETVLTHGLKFAGGQALFQVKFSKCLLLCQIYTYFCAYATFINEAPEPYLTGL